MPNWVKNRITLLNGENVEETLKDVLSKIDKGKLYFDFDKLIPMPKSLDIESSSNYDDYFKVYLNTSVDNQIMYNVLIEMAARGTFYKPKDFILDEKEINEIYEKSDLSKEEILKIGKQVADNFLQYGCKDWYDWRVKHWGTKWNSCGCEIYDNVIEFDTAWDFAEPIAKALFRKYPNINFEWLYSEEQISVYGGFYQQIDGEINKTIFEENSKEIYELAFDLWGCEDDYKYNENTGTYEYKED